MRFIPSFIHGILDYLTGIFLIAMPSIFGFDNEHTAATICDVAGGAVIIYSTFTNYELGISKNINLRIHLLLDLISGILLAVSPFVFELPDQARMPFIITGVFEILVVLFSERVPRLKTKRYGTMQEQ